MWLTHKFWVFLEIFWDSLIFRRIIRNLSNPLLCLSFSGIKAKSLLLIGNMYYIGGSSFFKKFSSLNGDTGNIFWHINRFACSILATLISQPICKSIKFWCNHFSQLFNTSLIKLAINTVIFQSFDRKIFYIDPGVYAVALDFSNRFASIVSWWILKFTLAISLKNLGEVYAKFWKV